VKYSADYEIRARMPATLDAVEEFLSEFRKHADAILAKANCFAAELLIREAATNAVVHGCHADPRKQVYCLARIRGSRLTLKIVDEGEGFDWRAIWNRDTDPSVASGRGIAILRKYAERVRFNDKGNVVTITRKCV
jgi:serine/threonine-protein kinase RsbW